MHLDTSVWVLAILSALMTLGLAGCSETPSEAADLSLVPGAGETVFLVMPFQTNLHMEALFQGRVVRDDSGCVRLQPPSDATVVWPFGFTLEPRTTGEWVVMGNGEDLGFIGGSFRFGGGEVPALHRGLGFSNELAGQIHDRCPGRFWIVGAVTTS